VNFNSKLVSSRKKLVSEESLGQEMSIAPNTTINVYNTIILAIVKDQEKIIGPMALNEANSVKGLQLSDDYNLVTISGDPEKVANELVSNFKALFGNASIEIMKESINKAMQQNPSMREANINIKL
jgi:hypothetical protein